MTNLLKKTLCLMTLLAFDQINCYTVTTEITDWRTEKSKKLSLETNDDYTANDLYEAISEDVNAPLEQIEIRSAYYILVPKSNVLLKDYYTSIDGIYNESQRFRTIITLSPGEMPPVLTTVKAAPLDYSTEPREHTLVVEDLMKVFHGRYGTTLLIDPTWSCANLYQKVREKTDHQGRTIIIQLGETVIQDDNTALRNHGFNQRTVVSAYIQRPPSYRIEDYERMMLEDPTGDTIVRELEKSWDINKERVVNELWNQKYFYRLLPPADYYSFKDKQHILKTYLQLHLKDPDNMLATTETGGGTGAAADFSEGAEATMPTAPLVETTDVSANAATNNTSASSRVMPEYSSAEEFLLILSFYAKPTRIEYLEGAVKALWYPGPDESGIMLANGQDTQTNTANEFIDNLKTLDQDVRLYVLEDAVKQLWH